MISNERTVRERTAFRGRAVRVDVVDIEFDDGARSVREIVRHPGAVVVLGETRDGRFVFVRQFRKAIEKVLFEAVAGTLNPGEDPDEAARRELREETGYEAEALVKLGVFCAAPGYSEERLHVYHAALRDRPAGPSPDEDERVEPVPMSAAEFERRVAAGEIEDAKTLATWLLYRARGPQAARRDG